MAVLYSSAPFLVMILGKIFDNVITECNAPDNSTCAQLPPPELTPGICLVFLMNGKFGSS